MSRFKYRAGFRSNVTADVAGKRITELCAKRKSRHLPPQVLVDDSRPDDAPLHPVFEWDDFKAAEAHRRDQAGALIRNILPVREQENDPDPVVAYVSVTVNGERGYMSTARVMSDAELRAQAISEALAGLQAWTKRYEYLDELQPVIEAVRSATKTAKAPKAPRLATAAV